MNIINKLQSTIINEDITRIIAEDLDWQQLYGSTVLVTGASGMIPSYVVYTMLGLNDMKKAGLSDVQMRFFEGDRHEILNELDRKEVYQYLLDWLDARFE